MKNIKDKTIYDADSIQSLDPREHIRLRYGMYVGENSTPNQLLLEVFSNALDEYNIGHGKSILVQLSEDGWVKVADEGQGFPIDEMREDGKSVFEAAFSVINTSGKFSDDGVYGGSALGLNGVGGKVANFLSKEFEANTCNNGRMEIIHFTDGILDSREVKTCAKGNHGTCIKYLPDAQFFDTGKTDGKYFLSFFQDISCLCPGLEIVFNDQNYGKIRNIKSDNGIVDLVESRVKDKQELIQNRFVYHGNDFDAAATFVDESSSNILAYVNYGYTDSGPHITGVKTAITRVFNSWAKSQGLLKAKEKNIDGASIQEGLILAFSLVSKGVAYNAQTKEKVVKCDTSFLDDFSTQLEVWLDNNPEDGKAIVEKALIARRAAEAAKRAREAVKQKAVSKSKKKFLDMPTSLIDCKNKDRSKCELMVVEGRSAASSLVAQRDATKTAVYSVRGMMLNLRKQTKDKILQNKEINNLIMALGLDYDSVHHKMIFDEKKLRYGKIIAASDADPAGNEIENLLFNILWELCPELIIKGYVYSAEPPLFRATLNDNSYYFLADQKALSEFQKKHKNIKEIHRAKGLAEQLPEQLADSLLNEETRRMRKLTVSDIEKTSAFFEDLYGKEVQPRVDYISENPWGVQVDYE